MRPQLIALVLALTLAVLGQPLRADSVAKINADSVTALQVLRDHAKGTDKLLQDAAGVLVFPDVVKMGFGVGGQYGEGVLLVDDKPAAYYATAGASFGLQLGIQTKSEVILFMTDEALGKFRNSRGWEVGVDGSVAVIKVGAGGSIDTRQITDPVVGFIFSNKGLMYNLTLEGAKMTRIAR